MKTVIPIGIFCVFHCACAATLGMHSNPGDREIGYAVYYSDKLHGRTTASGEVYDNTKFTAAHENLPFGSMVKVTNQANLKSVRVKINDRGPFGKSKRIIDLSKAAAKRIEMIKAGVQEVTIEIISIP